MRISIRKLNFRIFLLLVALMPFHHLVFSKLFSGVKILSLWRDLLIVYLLLYSFKDRVKVRLVDMLVLLVTGLFFCAALSTGNFYTLNIARTYVMPLLIFFYLRNTDLKEQEKLQLIKTCWFVAVAIALWGLLQAFVLGPEILFRIGYSNSGGRFSSYSFYISGWSQQRVVGTFSSPNACGAYFALMILFLFTCRDRITKHKLLYLAGIVVIALGLIASFSRSAILGCVIGLLLFNTLKVNSFRYKTARWIFAVLVLLVAALPVLLKNAMIIKVVQMATGHLKNTVSGADASFAFHLQELYQPIQTIARHPFGLGFGTNGSFALSVFSSTEVHLVESSVWLIAYELGILGAAIYFLPFLCFSIQAREHKEEDFFRTAMKSLVCTLVIFLSLPSVQNYEHPFFVMLFIGLAVGSAGLKAESGFLERSQHLTIQVGTGQKC